jgi:hypothetical protein
MMWGSPSGSIDLTTRAAIFAAVVYVMAYTARREHALDHGGRNLPGGFREALSSHTEAYSRTGPSGKE